jgi:cell wall assembly regulator SMI1
LKRIAAWYAANTPADTLRLPPGATKDQVRDTEVKLGLLFPDDVHEYFRLHDGLGWLLYYGWFLSLKELLRQWEMYSEWQQKDGYGIGPDWEPTQLSGPIRPVWWNPRRIHLTDNSGDHMTLDFDAPAEGQMGQIIWHNHEVGPVEVVATSFSAWLARMADDLEAGKYEWRGECGQVEPREWRKRRAGDNLRE